ncbi:MAG: hypothetical protein ACR2QB_12400, partial [Gammaproteobacteria bacterium]
MPAFSPDPQGAGRCFRLRTLTVFLLLFGLSLALPASAQEADTPGPTAIPADVAESIDAQLARTSDLIGEIRRLETQAESAEGLGLQVLEARLARHWDDLISTSQGVVAQILSLEKSGQDIGPYRDAVQTVLTATPTAIFTEIDRAGENITLPSPDQTAAEQAAVDANAGIAIGRVTSLYKAVIKNVEQTEAFGLPTEAVNAEINTRLQERAASVSAFLDIAIA